MSGTSTRTVSRARPRADRFGRFRKSRVGRLWRHGTETEIMQRSFSFAALGFTTLVPLLIVVAAATSLRGDGGFPGWIVSGIGLSGRSAAAVRQLFTSNGRVLSTTTAASVVGLAFFGLSLVDCVKRGFEHIWDLPPAGLRSIWRQAVWLAVLVGFLLAVADMRSAGHGSWIRTAVEITSTALGSLAFFWWTARFLLDGRVDWRPLLPGAALTVIGLGGLRATSSLFFAPFVVSSAVSYGAIGTVLIIVSWLIGVGYVIFCGALVGRHMFGRRVR
jgi:membrane protein